MLLKIATPLLEFFFGLCRREQFGLGFPELVLVALDVPLRLRELLLQVRVGMLKRPDTLQVGF